MPTTSSGDTVYADPDEMEEYVQTDPNQFSLSDSGSDPTEWRKFLESLQVKMKARIDEYVDRQDFEYHSDVTVTLDGGASASRILYLPSPVWSVSEVRVDDETLEGGGYGGGGYGEPLDDTQYDWRKSGQLIRLDDTDGEDEQWPTGYRNIEVDLDWGYQTPPADVQEAEMKLVAHTVTGLAQLREGMVVQQDDVDVTVQLPEAMTTEIKNMLRKHRQSKRVAGVI